MRMVDLIEKKMDGHSLSTAEIDHIVRGFVEGEIPDYQMSAFMMAVVFSGMDERETADLTLSMMRSGDLIDLSSLPGIKVDKHSTGGVGDTTTIVVAPLVAACGGTVAKMSGRGLGHTGGTIDKLESIPGFQVEQPMERFLSIVAETGVAVIGQSGNLVPEDKKMYALRDVTATVRSVPLIAGSIMSKKLAAGADAIVLDVKVGTGAFMRTLDEARELAKRMVDIGERLDRHVVAVITDMNQPLGLAVGNALEFREAIELLSGKIPQSDPLFEVCMLLGTHMLLLSKLAEDEADAKRKLLDALYSGRGLARLQKMVAAEGGDSAYISVSRIDELCKVKQQIPVYPREDGFITDMNAERIGTAAQLLGAGRATKDDVIDHAVGLVMHKRLGDRVQITEPLCTLYVNDCAHLDEARRSLLDAVTVSKEPAQPRPIVYEVVRA